MKIALTTFRGIAPKINEKNLPDNAAIEAVNCQFESGKIVPLMNPLVDNENLLSTDTKTFYPYDGNWLQWDKEVSVLASPIPQDQYSRLYIFGDGAPRIRCKVDGIAKEDDLAIPAPVTFPTVVNVNAPGTLSSTQIDVVYAYTYVTEMGEEGPPSPPSPLVTVKPDTYNLVTLPGVAPAVDRAITKIRLYRLQSGLEGQDYRFVQELDITDDSFTDNIHDLDLDEALPSTSWLQPDAGLEGAVQMAGGHMAAWKTHTVYFSEPYMPTAWPAEYTHALEHDIVAMASVGSTLIVGTKGNLYAISSPAPDQSLPTKLPLWAPCVSRRSMIAIGDKAYYASHDGLVVAGNGGAEFLTAATVDRKTWQSWKPETMVAGTWDKKLIMFGEDVTLVFDLQEPELLISTCTELAQAALVWEDKLFLRQDTDLSHWAGSEIPMVAVWRSKEFTLQRPVAWSVARVVADDYPVGVAFFSEETDRLQIHARQNTAFRLPPMRPEKNWSFRFETTATIDEISIATSMGDFNHGG